MDRRDAIQRGECSDYRLDDSDLKFYFEFEKGLNFPEAYRIFQEEWEIGACEMGS